MVGRSGGQWVIRSGGQWVSVQCEVGRPSGPTMYLKHESSELGAKSLDSLGAPKPILPLGCARRAEGWYAP